MDKVGEQQACLCGKAQTQNVGGGEANRYLCDPECLFFLENCQLNNVISKIHFTS